ncbi:flagellar hook-basal body protein [Butyrivibrio sp. MC2013]|uniref:flagellar hook-basal body protein n=1 Tax=Butyrivibrio sp. MC2013 TaxID=1280686 RepID=UPI0004195D79|nr:flagellar hook-basal body protein [Butyrivibrio sp. MC2013]
MVRSLWSAATGMNAQQTNVDTIANNLANVNTTGFKAQGAQFKSLLYQNLNTVTTTANGDPKPTTSQVGLGVRTAALTQYFSQGSLLDNPSTSAVAISGDGFFSYNDADGRQVFTRNGDFIWAIGDPDGESLVLTTSDGNPVLNTEGEEIRLENGEVSNKITIGIDGTIYYPDEDGVPQEVGHRIGLWQFQNPGGLERLGSTSWAVSAASGPAMNEAENEDLTSSILRQGYLEGSNVNVATEMVNLIVAQRAYEMNSTAITTTDSMMQTANQLKR